MPRHSSRRRGGSFALPRKTIRKPPTAAETLKRLEAKKRAEEAKAEREAKAAEEAAKRPEGPSKKERKRLALRKHLVAQGKLEETDKEVRQLTKLKEGVVHAEVNCQDEVELRKRFHCEGAGGNTMMYFCSTAYSFRYLLAKDGTPVAQIVKKLVTNGRSARNIVA
mmetsp:Transcript_42148/g.66825  ORF Transcript_42148/g.66825 Transcript_42148/m.66825 type:complete len:166 (+) Transcript_42148:75-572(+)